MFHCKHSGIGINDFKHTYDAGVRFMTNLITRTLLEIIILLPVIMRMVIYIITLFHLNDADHGEIFVLRYYYYDNCMTIGPAL